MSAHVGPQRRRICYLSGTRADFGLMREALRRIDADPELDLSIIVTGTHLSEIHGHTVDEITGSGLNVVAKIPVDVQTCTPASMSKGIADCLWHTARLLESTRPDMLLLLGDRGEMLAGAVAALNQGIATVHVHGGELSGTVDEPVRHAISKLCSYHLVATEGARDRLIRMGEAGNRIHVVGAPGLDGLTAMAERDRSVALKDLGLPNEASFLLAAFHPVVQQADQAREQTLALLGALRRVGLPVIWLEPNADAGARGVIEALDIMALPAGSRRVAHLPRQLFATAMLHASAMVGNSSAGIIEAASFGTPVVNVGGRQHLRERNPNTIDVLPQTNAISDALLCCLDRGGCAPFNRYGDGHSAPRIAQLMRELPLSPAVLEKTNAY